MKTNKFYSVIFLLAVVLVFNACSDDSGDTTKPVIVLNAPVEGAVLKIGSDIHLDMDLSDNEMLSSYKIEIHNNMENPHDHGTTKTKMEYFSLNKSWDVPGKKNTHVHHHDIIIPENAIEGPYHFIVYCTDAEGNESYVARNIVLSHDGQSGHEH